MAKKLMTIKEYAIHEGVTSAAIRKRIRRGTCYTVIRYGVKLVFVDKDRTVKKPRKKKKQCHICGGIGEHTFDCGATFFVNLK